MNSTNQILRRALFGVLGCSLIILLAGVVHSQKAPQEQEEFAQEALESYVKHVLNEKNFANFGFRSLGEAQVARVGDPYSVMFIGLTDLQAYEPGTGARPLLVDPKILWYPVVVEGETRTKVEIVEKDGEWLAGEFGQIRPVQAASRAQDRLPRLLESIGADVPDKPAVLVRIPALQATFLYIERAGEEFLISAMVQPQRYGLEAEEIYPADEVLSRLAEYAAKIDENTIR